MEQNFLNQKNFYQEVKLGNNGEVLITNKSGTGEYQCLSQYDFFNRIKLDDGKICVVFK